MERQIGFLLVIFWTISIGLYNPLFAQDILESSDSKIGGFTGKSHDGWYWYLYEKGTLEPKSKIEEKEEFQIEESIIPGAQESQGEELQIQEYPAKEPEAPETEPIEVFLKQQESLDNEETSMPEFQSDDTNINLEEITIIP